MLAGQPTTLTYAAVVARAFTLLTRAAAARAAAEAAGDLPKASHRRGLFAAVTVGISYGQGQVYPAPLHCEHAELAKQLVDDSSFQEIASFGSCELSVLLFVSCANSSCLAMLAFWAPKLYTYYREHNAKLDPTLAHPRPFPRSVFASATFNLGPNAWTFKHRDVLNLPFGWCAITALGDFDPTKGGHLVLWDLKLVIEFPPGATILIPSATLAHSNIPVSAHEHRASFTQYTAGGLFRFVDNGLQTQSELTAKDPEEFERIVADKEGRWKMGLALWSTLDELVALSEPTEQQQ